MTHSLSARTRARRLGGVLAGTLALGLIPLAGPASAAEVSDGTLRNIRGFACPAEPDTGTITSTDVPEDGFTDVAASNPHEFSIDCVRWYQITSGKTATTYQPDGNVRRDQMASFIAQMIDYVAERTPEDDGLDPAPAGNAFPCDVNTNNVHFANIQRLKAANVIQGSGNSSAGACFDPDGAVSRAQMATFLRQANAVLKPIAAAAESEDFFVDDETSNAEGNINAIAKVGLAEGAGKNTNNEDIYNPNVDVRRDQIASFITRALDRLIDLSDAQAPATATVTIPSSATQGGTIAITVDADRGNFDKATVSGCGATTPAEADPNPNTGSAVTFNAPISATQATGNCTLTVVSTLTDAVTADVRTKTDTRTVTIAAP